MALLRRPGAAAPDEFGELANLWIAGLNAPHDVGCGCGGMAGPVFDASDLEVDLLDYLLGKYRAGAPEGLADFLLDRRDNRANGRFETWVAGLGAARLSEQARARLAADLRVFLVSFAERARPRIGVCY